MCDVSAPLHVPSFIPNVSEWMYFTRLSTGVLFVYLFSRLHASTDDHVFNVKLLWIVGNSHEQSLQSEMKRLQHSTTGPRSAQVWRLGSGPWPPLVLDIWYLSLKHKQLRLNSKHRRFIQILTAGDEQGIWNDISSTVIYNIKCIPLQKVYSVLKRTVYSIIHVDLHTHTHTHNVGHTTMWSLHSARQAFIWKGESLVHHMLPF